jgi:SAM-dependent methyltransferase
LAEFTGERVIPGEVDPDLFNEHLARYLFASRIAGGRRVLDAGCGTGYGAAELARAAREVVGIDISQEAVDYARTHYAAANLRFDRSSCLEIPAAGGAFGLVVAFEIIEHLEDWRAFLREVARVLAPDGRFLVSTPNKVYYGEARAELGPNPFHVHEFDYAEFRAELETIFPRVTVFFENHSAAVVFAPETVQAIDAQMEQAGEAADAHFFLAVCSTTGDTAIPAFAYVPRAANMLLERERHIELIKTELAERVERVVELQDELASQKATARARIDELEAITNAEVATSTRLANELDAKVVELVQCVEYLHAAEATIEERTAWARRAQVEADLVAAYRASRWVKLGKKLGLGPVLDRPK